MLRLSHIGQIAVVVHDTARATAFYRDALGLSLLFEAPPDLVWSAFAQPVHLAKWW